MITKDVLVKMLYSASGLIRENEAMLGELDSHGGDGDHGTTIVRAMGCMEKAVEDNADANLKDLLTAIGWGIMGVDGGATGPLFGTFFMSMAPVADGKDALDAPAVADAFEAALAGIGKRSKAKPGD
jgi:dihydroxyacetone kinase-like protein